jgi:hypothetical protein
MEIAEIAQDIRSINAYRNACQRMLVRPAMADDQPIYVDPQGSMKILKSPEYKTLVHFLHKEFPGILPYGKDVRLIYYNGFTLGVIQQPKTNQWFVASFAGRYINRDELWLAAKEAEGTTNAKFFHMTAHSDNINEAIAESKAWVDAHPLPQAPATPTGTL